MSTVTGSAMVDTWLQLRNTEANGECNRLLFVLRSRGTAHSNQVREFVLTDHGVELVDVYVGAAGVLAGSARVTQQAAERDEELRIAEELARRRRELHNGEQPVSEPHTASDGTGADTAGTGEQWDLCLYVTDRSPKFIRAMENLRRAREEHLAGRYAIEIVDLLENPRRAADDQILAVPTVVRRFPRPIRKLVGHLSDSDRLLVGLELRRSGSQRDAQPHS